MVSIRAGKIPALVFNYSKASKISTMQNNPSIEEIWDSLLSRNPKLIESVFNRLDGNEQRLIIEHLNRMVKERDWHKVQKESAKIALQTIEKSQEGNKTK